MLSYSTMITVIVPRFHDANAPQITIKISASLHQLRPIDIRHHTLYTLPDIIHKTSGTRYKILVHQYKDQLLNYDI